MAKFMVYESAQTVYMYEVEAESQDKAKEIVEEGTLTLFVLSTLSVRYTT
jgi:hypothetical protein